MKIVLAFFFGLAFFINTLNRFYHRAELRFSLSPFEWILLVTTFLVFINTKGIKIFVLLVFTLFSVQATRDAFLFHRSGTPRGLLLKELFDFLDLDSSIVYLAHMIIYIMLCWLMFISSKAKNNQLLDQD